MIFFDVLIVIRVALLRKKSHTELFVMIPSRTATTTTVSNPGATSLHLEIRLALSFLLLSVCFLVPTIVFNGLNLSVSHANKFQLDLGMGRRCPQPLPLHALQRQVVRVHGEWASSSSRYASNAERNVQMKWEIYEKLYVSVFKKSWLHLFDLLA